MILYFNFILGGKSSTEQLNSLRYFEDLPKEHPCRSSNSFWMQGEHTEPKEKFRYLHSRAFSFLTAM